MKPETINNTEWLKYNWYFLLEHLIGVDRMAKHFGSRRMTLYNKISARLHSKKEVDEQFLPELGHREAYGDFGQVRKMLKGPVIFRGAAGDWPCISKWDLDFFVQHYGEREIFLNDFVGIVDPETSQTYQKITLREYADLLRNGSLSYLKFSNLVQKEPVLQADLDLDWLHKFDKTASFGKTFYMFIGGKGSITPMHNEFPSVVYAQVSGRKRCVIYLPEDRIFLDPRTERRIYFYSKAIPERPDHKAYPLIRYARKYEFILDPGDVLWFPPFAWHYVENLSESIGVSYKFANIRSSWQSSKMMSMLFYAATRPNPFYSFIASRFKKDDYTLTKSDSELQ